MTGKLTCPKRYPVTDVMRYCNSSGAASTHVGAVCPTRWKQTKYIRGDNRKNYNARATAQYQPTAKQALALDEATKSFQN
jgi:hypothetical protein